MGIADIAANVKEALVPIAAELGAEVAEVTYHEKRRPPVLLVTVARPDSSESLDADQVADLARAFSKKLDEVDPIESEYIFEVSTPGIEDEAKEC